MTAKYTFRSSTINYTYCVTVFPKPYVKNCHIQLLNAKLLNSCIDFNTVSLQYKYLQNRYKIYSLIYKRLIITP